MKDSLYIITKYWRRHKRSLLALLFSGVLLTVVVSVSLLHLRANFNRWMHQQYDFFGLYDTVMPNAREEFVQSLSDENTLRGEIYVLGKVNNGGENYSYGFLDDPDGIAHIPMESGRLPEREGEIAVDRAVLERFGYFGMVGDSISLDIGEYTLVGIIDKKYGWNRYNSEIQVGRVNKTEVIVYPTPLIFVSPADKARAQYSLTMLHKLKAELVEKDKQNESYINNIIWEEYRPLRESLPDDSTVAYLDLGYSDKDHKAARNIEANRTDNDSRLVYMWAGLAAVIAVLSVLSVLRNIFAERRSSMEMLHRIGMSKRRIKLLYAVECGIFLILQTVIGIALGIVCHLAICAYQVNVLDMTPYSGLTLDPFITNYTADPFIGACIFSAVVLPVGYIFAGLLSSIKPHLCHGKKAASLHGSFAKTFRTSTVTVIQTAALTLICFGTMIGYMFFTDSGKREDLIGISYFEKTVESFGSTHQFSFEEDGLEEYYHAPSGGMSQVGSFKFIKKMPYPTGIGDDTANRFEGAVSTGRLENTFVITKAPHEKLKHCIVFGTDEEKQFMIDNTAEEYKSLFADDNYLYSMQTALADEHTVGSLSDFVISGKINVDKLRSGEEVILLSSGDAPLSVGDSITLASAVTENGYGLSGLVTADTTVGAIVKLNNPNKLLKYAVATGDDYGLLTTASGAKAMGLHGAAYTEVFAEKPLDGKLFPIGSGMTLLSYSAEKHKIFVEKAMQYGSTILIVLLMSLLGFAAYFNGIGMKVRLKEYEISTMRAIGVSTKTLRQKLMLYSLKIPLMACAASYCCVKLVQRICYSAYLRHLDLYKEVFWEGAGGNFHGESFGDYQLEMEEVLNKMADKYFLNNELWLVKTVIPMLIILAVMSVITVVLTRLAFRRFGADISQSMSNGRKRR